MKNRFKVRAWNNRTKEYVNEKGINTIYKGAYNATMLLGLFQYLKDDKIIQVIAKDFEFEQCTGLKDKNGKLIHEGDIVVDESYDAFTKDKLYEVAVDNDECYSFFLDGINVDYYTEFYDVDLERLEIIGNIHENPELLEGNNG